jgi:hypothetical protein
VNVFRLGASRAALFIVAAFAARTAAPLPQQVATTTPTVQTAFRSPMILTAKFAPSDRSLWRKGEWFSLDEYRDLSKFTCDGVLLRGNMDSKSKIMDPGLEFAVTERPDGILVKARVSVWNPPRNHDKSVTVVLEVLAGTNPMRQATIGPLDAEAGHSPQQGETKFIVHPLLMAQELTLRLTMTVTNR